MGFEAPEKFWDMNAEFEEMISNSHILKTIFNDIKKVDLPKMRWKLLSVALWEKKFGMEIED